MGEYIILFESSQNIIESLFTFCAFRIVQFLYFFSFTLVDCFRSAFLSFSREKLGVK